MQLRQALSIARATARRHACSFELRHTTAFGFRVLNNYSESSGLEPAGRSRVWQRPQPCEATGHRAGHRGSLATNGLFGAPRSKLYRHRGQARSSPFGPSGWSNRLALRSNGAIPTSSRAACGRSQGRRTTGRGSGVTAPCLALF